MKESGVISFCLNFFRLLTLDVVTPWESSTGFRLRLLKLAEVLFTDSVGLDDRCSFLSAELFCSSSVTFPLIKTCMTDLNAALCS